ncbi:hypothetical protein [Bacteroides sp. UBA939]|uniref:hypothetical protein n=1 Tax=Bacteroides sp. UBA939 TaxID=1946092 RepID=UPI0025C72BD6|nr:hypothetical protein [Bacteroides sp. UBA939]
MDNITLFEEMGNDTMQGHDMGDIEIEESINEDIGNPDGNIFMSLLSKVKIPGFIVGSAIDGALNALLTLRIGYVTRYYLQNGVESLKGSGRKQARSEAIKSAFSALPNVIVDSSSVIGKNTANVILKFFRK